MPDILARFILGGMAILLASERLIAHSALARRFFVSRAWVVLRYLLIGACGVLCLIVLQQDWS